MILDRAIRLAQAWADGRVCSLRDGEAQEYHKLALSAFRAQTEAEENNPLTLDELWEMDGEPVYCWRIAEPENSLWGIVCVRPKCPYVLTRKGRVTTYFYFDYLGTDWLAYRRKPIEI